MIYSYKKSAAHDPYDGSRYLSGWETTRQPLRKIITSHATSPIIFRGGDRYENNFMVSYYCVLDFDGDETPLTNAVDNIFCDMSHLIATTRNHQKVKDGRGPWDRYRAWTIWEKPITSLETYIYNMERLIRKYDADIKCKDGARLFYQSQEIVSINTDGSEKMEVKEPTEAWNRRHKEHLREAVKEIDHITLDARQVIKGHIEPGERNQTFYRGCRDLYRVGYQIDQVQDFILKSPTYINSNQKHQRGYLVTAKSALTNLNRKRSLLDGQE